jgi:hypothetical protein
MVVWSHVCPSIALIRPHRSAGPVATQPSTTRGQRMVPFAHAIHGWMNFLIDRRILNVPPAPVKGLVAASLCFQRGQVMR